MAYVKEHTWAEIEALSESESDKLFDELAPIAEELGCEDTDFMNIYELEQFINIRQKPTTEFGHKPTKDDIDICYKVFSGADKFKKKIISSLNDICEDGCVEFKHPIKIKDEEGYNLKAVSMFVNYDCEEDEETFVCEVKDAPDDFFDVGENFVEVNHLTLSSLLSLVSAISEKKATIFSRQEMEEINRRND